MGLGWHKCLPKFGGGPCRIAESPNNRLHSRPVTILRVQTHVRTPVRARRFQVHSSKLSRCVPGETGAAVQGCAGFPSTGGATVSQYIDKLLTCIDCEAQFVFSAGEQLFFADKGLRNEPKRCKDCKVRKNERIAANMQAFGQAFPRERVEVSVRCALCAVETTVPFRPTQGRPVYCRDCFLKMRASIAHSAAAPPA
jgi:CxxC-x17-CxxC domain-containing protein